MIGPEIFDLFRLRLPDGVNGGYEKKSIRAKLLGGETVSQHGSPHEVQGQVRRDEYIGREIDLDGIDYSSASRNRNGVYIVVESRIVRMKRDDLPLGKSVARRVDSDDPPEPPDAGMTLYYLWNSKMMGIGA